MAGSRQTGPKRLAVNTTNLSFSDEPPLPAGNAQLAAQKLLQKRKRRKFVDVIIEGEELRFYYRDLDWIPKSEAISTATEMIPRVDPKTGQTNIETKIHFGRYFAACLRLMIIDPPFPLTDQMIEALSGEAGEKFEQIVPGLWDTAQQVNMAKKKSGTASRETSSLETTLSSSDDT